MYYIFRKDVKDFNAFIEKLQNRHICRNKHSCNKRNAVAIATYFAGTEIREFIFLSERMCDSDPHISWITSRIKCDTEEEFLKRVDDKIKNQIENRKMKLSFQQKQDLSNSIQGVLNLNQDMNNILVGILKSTEKKLIRTDNDADKSTIYAFVYDDYFTFYEEKRVLAVTIFEGRFIGVLVGAANATLDGMTDEAILEMDEWYTINGGYLLSNATLYNLCENIEEYL